MSKNTSNNKNNEAITAAIDLPVSKDVDLSNVLSEGGLLKQLTKRLVEKALQSEMKSSRLG
jgi:putative transposase